MSYDIRKIPDEIVLGLAYCEQQRIIDAVTSGTKFHKDRTSVTVRGLSSTTPTVTRLQITAANATDATTALTLTNAIKTAVNTHFPDAVAHNTAVSAVVATATATDTTTAVTLANAIKAAYNTHLSASNVHYNNDGTNTATSANATDATTLITLVNELKGDFNAHVSSAPDGVYPNLVRA